jgi:hypothetical protein
MSKASPALTNFNAGEFSPMLEGRIDFDRYQNGCMRLENFIPSVQGPAVRRGGTRFVAPVKTQTNRVWLQSFEFSQDQAYVLEFGDQYVRFYTLSGQLVSGSTPVEVATPYTQANLFSPDGTCRLRFAQSGDFLYITHPQFAPRILKRTSPLSFALEFFDTKGGPFKDVNPDETATVYASGETGTVTLTASAPVFTAGHVGTKFLMESSNTGTTPAWEAGKRIADVGESVFGLIRKSDGKYYRCVTVYTVPAGGREARSGTTKPVHTRGVASDGDGNKVTGLGSNNTEFLFADRQGVDWEFLHAGYGWVEITSVGGGGTTATGTVISRIPAECVGASNATTRWAHSSWSAAEGWPSAVTFFRERLCFSRGQRLWMSTAAGFDDFSARNSSGEVAADQAISLEVASGEINEIQWLHADRELIAGTAGGEFSIGDLTNGDPLGPGNVKVQLRSRFGTRGVQPVGSGSSTLFLLRAGTRLREIAYDFSGDDYDTKDVTTLSEHITKPSLVDMDYALDPYSVVWCVRSDGGLVGFTWNNEENVKGWHRHIIGGNGAVETVAVIPKPDNTGDQVWMVVRRTINGQTRRYVEFMENPWERGQPQADAFYVDSGLTYAGSPVTTLSGLSHLEGQVVDILTDGSPHPQRTVTSGAITLNAPASKVQVGLPCPCNLWTMRLEAGASDGTAQGKTKRMHKITFRLLDTGGLKVGPSAAVLDELQFRTPADPMDAPVPLFTGDKLVAWPSSYETEARVFVSSDKPLPLTLVAIYPQVVTQDAR